MPNDGATAAPGDNVVEPFAHGIARAGEPAAEQPVDVVQTTSPAIELGHLQRRSAYTAVTLPATLIAVLGFAVFYDPDELAGHAALGLTALGGAAIAILAGMLAQRAVRHRAGRLEVSHRGVTVQLGGPGTPEREVVVPREEIDSAIAGPSSVSFKLKDGRTLSALVSPELPDVLVRAVGLSAEQHRAAVRLRSRLRDLTSTLGTGAGLLAALVLIGTTWVAANDLGGSGAAALITGALGLLISIGLPAAMIYLSLWRWRSLRVTVGTDGVVVHGGLRDRFVRFEDLRAVERVGSVLRLALRDGRAVHLNGGRSPDDLAALALRIEEARAVYARGEGDATAARAALARGQRTLGEWRAALAELSKRTGGYRDAALSLDDLRTLVRDTAASVEHRVAAALALAARRDTQDQAAIRTAAAQVASTHVRVALERIAQGDADEAAIEQALRDEPAAATAGRSAATP
jgi:hypothetical protein